MEWISVKDRLPELFDNNGYDKSNLVAVLIEGKTPMIAELNKGEDESGEWEQWFNWQYEDVISEVTHWMPLPEPPKALTNK